MSTLQAAVCLAVMLMFTLAGLLIQGVSVYLDTVINSLGVAVLGCLFSLYGLKRFLNYPKALSIVTILPLVSSIFITLLLVVFFLRLDYSRPTLILGWLGTVLGCLLVSRILNKTQHKRYLRPDTQYHSEVQLPLGHQVEPLAIPALPVTKFDGLIVDLRQIQNDPHWADLVCDCVLKRIPVYDEQALRESLSGQTRIDEFSFSDFNSLLPNPNLLFVKRLSDYLVCATLAPVALPLLLLGCVLVKLDSPGPVIFKQNRVGFKERTFTLYKLRTMSRTSNSSNPTAVNDSRVTAVGRFLRKYRIDELPQLWNVLKGDMSIVGPRPEQQHLVEQYATTLPFYRYRHAIRPGITGWAQVNQGYAANLEDTKTKLEFDLYYIRHLSIWLDILILQKTIQTVVRSEGAR